MIRYIFSEVYSTLECRRFKGHFWKRRGNIWRRNWKSKRKLLREKWTRMWTERCIGRARKWLGTQVPKREGINIIITNLQHLHSLQKFQACAIIVQVPPHLKASQPSRWFKTSERNKPCIIRAVLIQTLKSHQWLSLARNCGARSVRKSPLTRLKVLSQNQKDSIVPVMPADGVSKTKVTSRVKKIHLPPI